ncbi:energy-coupling factor transporter transmembrane component T family protein [Vibrio panuliri]|uniref:Cobalt ECF transporter T component CbiQ n=1 Tax=Vibrio panuliri TaxID=1381081 RepID=A0ABX3F4R6_9VIBR|nr:energy-coupling factor transporter transmembrane component T [Vibrio panuliri]KAB1454014.1 hypothetical protein F7O85_14015 [Vibrio panuliri]OLQ84428.1 hypothetical protein BIY20_03780 [Vibrio panuliri]
MEALLSGSTSKNTLSLMPVHARLLVAVVVTVATVVSEQTWVYGCFALIACVLWIQSSMGVSAGLKRVAMIDSVVVLTILPLPFTFVGGQIIELGPLTLSQVGVDKALDILIKTTISSIVMMSQCSGVSSLELARALSVLRVPNKLILILQFCIRYLEVIEQELLVLETAMRARGFGNASMRRNWKNYGYLFGMLLIRSLARADRIWLAMKCRGYRGIFPATAGERATALIPPKALGWILLALILVALDWLTTGA